MALSIADRGYVLATGRARPGRQADELLASEDLKRAYLGPLTGSLPAGRTPIPAPIVSYRCAVSTYC